MILTRLSLLVSFLLEFCWHTLLWRQGVPTLRPSRRHQRSSADNNPT